MVLDTTIIHIWYFLKLNLYQAVHYDRIVLKTVFKRKIRLGLEYLENLCHPIIEQYRAQKIGRKSERNVESDYRMLSGAFPLPLL